MKYHHEIGFPACIVLPQGIFALVYGNHAVSRATLIEVETNEDFIITKLLYRLPYSDKQDICVAVLPPKNEKSKAHANSFSLCR